MVSCGTSWRRRRPVRVLGWLLVTLAGALWMTTVLGCGGCRKTDETAKQEEQRKKDELAKKKARKPDFEFRDLETLPSEDSANRNFVKPGHTVTAWVSALANYEDLRAQFETCVTDSQNHPIPIADTGYHLLMSRPAVLPKGQPKFLESTFFIPTETAAESSYAFLHHQLKNARSGQVVHQASQIARQMPPYQYLFPVLSSNPNAYGYLKQIESIRATSNNSFPDDNHLILYRVVLPSIQERMPLAPQPFSWTSLAYVLWDAVGPAELTPDQQTAMIDWLHWGGQLIVSGPGSLDRLKGSFLQPYLPVTGSSSVALGPADLEELNRTWSLPRQGTGTRLTLNVQETTPLVGVQLDLQPGGQLVSGTGGLVAERRVGRGRVVVTGFSLATPDVVNWGSYDGFFNACILRRPARQFTADRFGESNAQWFGLGTPFTDPQVLTTTRYFTRDAGPRTYMPPRNSTIQSLDWHLDGSLPNPVSGMGGWNDRSGPARLAHLALKSAAGISIPKASFVASVLAVYLIVLVPVNWGVFRLLGHVEWAWVAAPVIAIVGAVAVIRLAQLDIGFVRSRTEIAVLETHGGYARAHLTRYIALYSSLSADYELCFDDMSAMARPFPPTQAPGTAVPVTFRREGDVRLSGFHVRSSSTGFIHGEEMFDLGGAIELLGDQPLEGQLRNGSDWDLRNVTVIYRHPDGTLLTCPVDRLGAQATVALTFTPIREHDPWIPTWKQREDDVWGDDDATARFQNLSELAAKGMRLQHGEVRLVAAVDGVMPGLTIAPSASQTKARGVVLVHLRQSPLPLPLPDKNLLVDARRASAASDAVKGELDVLPDASEKENTDD